MTYEIAAREHEARLAAGPYTLAPDEPCDRCGADLGDVSYKVRHPRHYGVYDILCDACIEPAVRCDQCGCWRCACGEDER